MDPPSHGALSGAENRYLTSSTNKITYTPKSGFVGADSFTFKVNDGNKESINTGIVNIRVDAR